MEETTLSVLLVDDFEPFRRFLSLTLQQMPNARIVGEASDGLEAVRLANKLRPDLVLLDIGLPSLNGIAVAHRIRKLRPETNIIFVSQETDPDIVQECLTAGCAYVLKANAAAELSPALDAVLSTYISVSRLHPLVT